MKKDMFDLLNEYKFKTMLHCAGNNNLHFEDEICSLFKLNAVLSCPSWTKLKGTFDNLFAEDLQTDLFDNKERMNKAVYEVINIYDNLTFHLTFAQIENYRLDQVFDTLSNYLLDFKYSGNIGKIEACVLDDCPLVLDGLVSEKRFKDPTRYQLYDNSIFKVFKHFKTLISDDQIRSTGICRFFHNKEYTAIQLNFMCDEKQKEIITAISMNNTGEAREDLEKMEQEDLDESTGEVTGQTKLKIEAAIKKNKQKVKVVGKKRGKK